MKEPSVAFYREVLRRIPIRLHSHTAVVMAEREANGLGYHSQSKAEHEFRRRVAQAHKPNHRE